MSQVFLLHHVRELENEVNEVKVIGVYSTNESARAAVERLKDQPGFAEFPQGFDISTYHLDRDYWQEGFVSA